MNLREILPNTTLDCHLPEANRLPKHRRMTAKAFAAMAALSYDLTNVTKQFKSIHYEGGRLILNDEFYLLRKEDELGYQGFSCFRITRINDQSLHLGIIFSHCGTNSILDALSSWMDIAFFNYVPEMYTGQAQKMVEKSMKFLGVSSKASSYNKGKYRLSIQCVHVGHSLGGTIAQTLAARNNHFWLGFETPHLPFRAKGLTPPGFSHSAHNMINSPFSMSKINIRDETLGYTPDSYGKVGLIENHSITRVLREQFHPKTEAWLPADHGQLERDKKEYNRRLTMEMIKAHQDRFGKDPNISGYWPKM